MSLQHLRSSTAHKRPVPGNMSDGQIAINTNTGSPGLFFKDSNNALVKVGPVHVGTTAPNASPASGGTAGNSVGEQWLDTTGGTYVFKVWDGSAWRSESGTFVDVNGDVMTGALGIIAGTAGSPGLYVSGDANTGLYSPGADQIALATGGTGRLFVDSSGRVGIGTTGPGGRLQINVQDGFLFDVGAGAYAYMRFGSQGAGEGVAELALDRANGKVLLKTGNTGLALNTRLELDNAGTTIINNQSGTERARIDGSGRLLVGTSSARTNYLGGGTAPSVQLEATNFPGSSLSLTRNETSGAGAGLLLGRTRGASNGSNTAVAQDDGLGIVSFQGADGTNLIEGARISAAVDGTPGANDMPGRLVFSTTADGASSPTERMRITSDGYVRLSASSPGIQFGGDTAAANALDDYEEGTFTPTIVGTTSAGTGTYTNQIGRYTKIGDRVTFTVYLNWTAHTGTGNIRISNLPFTSTSATGSFHAASIYADGIPFTGPWLQAYVGVNSTNIGMGQMTAAGVVSGIPMDAAGDLTITGHYEV